MQPPDMGAVKRLLIVKLSSIGDVVHALPVSAAIKRAYPHVNLTWVVEHLASPMVTGNPFLDEVMVLPPEWRKQRFSPQAVRGFLSLRRNLHERRFDVALDLQGLSKSALVAWASGAPTRYGYDWMREVAPYLVHRVPRRPESVHVVDQFLDVARFLGARDPRVEFPLHIPDEDDAAVSSLLAEAGVDPHAPFAVINPSSGGGGFKGWPADRFGATADRLRAEHGLPSVLVGSRGDLGAAEAVASAARCPVASLVGKTSLKQLAAVLRRARLHVCGDTGSAHIAAALGTPVVSLFGRSDPARLAPYGQAHLAVHRRDLCKPACKRFHERAPVNSVQKCRTPPPACLAAITLDDVADACIRALQGVGGEGRPVDR